MAREHWFFIGGALAVLLPIVLAVAIKKLELLETRADAREVFSTFGGRKLHLHIFHAAGAQKKSPSPALLLFHGGGWRFGSPQQFYPQCQYFAAQGVTCISAEYRLGPNHLPDIAGAIEDAADALAYLHDNAARLAIDTQRLFAGGGSSGGQLALALGLGLHSNESPRPAGLALYNPVLDLSPCAPANYLAGEGWEAISPQHQINGGLPPTLILSGSEDPEVTPKMVSDFCNRAREVGSNCTNIEYAGQYHGFFNDYEGNTYFEKTNSAVLKFIQDME